MTLVVIGLGANLGDPKHNLTEALSVLQAHPQIAELECSTLVRSAPLGDKAQPAYCNAVARFRCGLAAEALLLLLQSLENRFGRVRGAERWASRTLDLDILAYGDAVIRTAELTVPHPEITRRPFVVQPWLEVDPEARLATGERLAELPVAVQAGIAPWDDAASNSRII